MFTNPDSIPRFSGAQKSPFCEACQSTVDSTEPCQGKGVHSCEGMPICEQCLTACSRCGDPFCRACEDFSLVEGLCETCRDELARANEPKRAA